MWLWLFTCDVISCKFSRQILCCCEFPKTISVFGFSSSFGFVECTLCIAVVLSVVGSLNVCVALILFLTVILAPCRCRLIHESGFYSRLHVLLKFIYFFFAVFIKGDSAWQCVLGRIASEACSWLSKHWGSIPDVVVLSICMHSQRTCTDKCLALSWQ